MIRYCGIAILVLAAIAAGAFGQTEIGLITGVNASRFNFAVSPEDAWSRRWTPLFGAFAAFARTKTLSPQIEFFYVGKGATATGTYDGSEVRIQERLAYVEGLALMNIRVWRRNQISIGVLAGLFGASRIGAKTLTSFQGETLEEDIRTEIQSLDYGVVAGLEGRWRSWRLNLRVTMGMADLRTERDVGSAVRNQSFSLTAGYGFRL